MANDIHELARSATRGLAPYVPGLSAEHVTQTYGVRDVVKLASNENPFGASPRVGEALAQALNAPSRYPDSRCSELGTLIASSLGVDRDRLVFGNGSEDILSCVARGFLDEDDRVVLSSPTFPVYADFSIAMKATVVDIPRRPDLTLDVDATCAALASRPKIFFLCNPNNPTGTAVGVDEFERLCAAADARTLIVVDEAYYEYARGPGYPESLEMLRSIEAPWLILRTFSKAYGLAGLRIGYGVASDPLIARQVNLVKTAFNVNVLAQLAATAAWNDRAALDRAVKHNAAERERVGAALAALGITSARSASNFLFFNARRGSHDLAEGLMRRGVIIRPWGGAFRTWLRVSLGTREENDRFLHALSEELAHAPALPHSSAALSEA